MIIKAYEDPLEHLHIEFEKEVILKRKTLFQKSFPHFIFNPKAFMKELQWMKPNEMVRRSQFPLRGKPVKLHIKRRRWTEMKSGNIVQRDWKLIAKGTRMTQDFAEFLKKIR